MRGTVEVTRVFLWRHPEVRGFEAGKFFGNTDVSLTKHGRDQAKAMADLMSTVRLSAIYSSDLERSRVTADAIARAQGRLLKPHVMKELRELNLGIWEGLTFEQINRDYPEELAARYADLANYQVENGESLSQLAERALPVFDGLITRYKGLDVCVVGHGGLNRVILASVLGAPLDNVFRMEQGYACLNIIQYYEDGFAMVSQLNRPVVYELS